MKKTFFVLSLCVLIVRASVCYAGTIHNITPYVGPLINKITSPASGRVLKDHGLLKGIYYQQIDPDRYQWNLFLYQGDDINQSDLLGGHIIADRYFKETDTGKFLIGAGMDTISLSSSPIAVTDSVAITVEHTIYAPYVRAGRYFYLRKNKDLNFTIMPWAGYETDVVRGDVTADIQPMFPGQPAISSRTSIDHTYEYGLAGLQLKVDYHHFLSCKLKYHRKFSFDSASGDLHNASAMVNVYLSKKWGVSYRFKYFEEITGSNSYHIFGVSYVF